DAVPYPFEAPQALGVQEFDQVLERAGVAELRAFEPAVRHRAAVAPLRAEARRVVDRFELAVQLELERFAARHEYRELDAGGAGVQDTEDVAHRLAALAGRLAFATSAISAAEASRLRTLSARLVSTIGTRVPSTRPAMSAPAR